MFIDTQKFGRVTYKKSDVITMIRNLLGFEDYRQFIIIAIKGQEPFKWLQSIEEPALAFLTIDPLYFMPDYVVDVHPRDIEMLGAASEKDVIVLALVSIPPGKPNHMSANLQGPIAINMNNHNAAQLVLGESNYSTNHSIFKELERRIAAVAVS